MAVALLLLTVLVVTAAGMWGEDSREGGDRCYRGSTPFRPERRID